MITKTKIVATIGPVTCGAESLRQLHAAGMNVARLNGSHNILEWHARTIATIRKTLPDVPILLDVPGKKIRTAHLAFEPAFDAGATIVLTTDGGARGRGKVPVSYDRLHEDLNSGDIVLADDGTLKFTVLEVKGRDIHCRAETAGQLKSRKGINVPHVRLKTDLVNERDLAVMAEEPARVLDVDDEGVHFGAQRHVQKGAHPTVRPRRPRI